MHDSLTFESRLADGYARYTAEALIEVDAGAIARLAITSRPHVAPLGFGRRSRPLARLLLVAALAVLAAIAVAALAGQLDLVQPLPSDVPTPSAASSSAPPSPSSASEAAVAMPRDVWGDWLADTAEIPGLTGAEPRIQLSLTWQDGLTAWVQINRVGTQVLHSTSVAAAAGEIRFRASNAFSGCAADDEGRYRWSRSADGLLLTLTTIEEACALRAATFGRTWVHSLGAVNDGRHGIVNSFDPAIEITLPSGGWAAGGAERAADIRGPSGLELIAIQDPRGFAEPCSQTGGAPVSISATADAFVAYMKSLPGFTVTTTEHEIDGRAAVHLAIVTSADTVCPGGRVFEFQSPDSTAPAGWSISPGDPDSMWIVEVDGHAYLLQYLGPGLTEAAELDVLSSVRFVHALPTS